MKAGILSILIVLFLITSKGVPAMAATYSVDYWPTRGWRTTTPEKQGMKSDVLADMLQYIRDKKLNLHSITIVRNGYLVMDNYFYPYSKNTKHNFRSCAQGVLSGLIGIAIEKKYIKNANQPMLAFFPDRTISNIDSSKQQITIENLLTMTSGLDCQDGGRHKFKGMYAMWRSKDWVQYVLDLPMTETPGERFEYCSGTSYLLSAILQKTSGMRSLDFARKYLFAPLGITDGYWETSPQGIDFGYDQLFLTPHDMAKIGWLYLNKGKWNGTQVVPEDWVNASRQGHIEITTPLADKYGYQWYIARDYYLSLGAWGQFILIAPEKNIVAVFTGAVPMGRQFLKVKNLFEEFILPSAVSDNAMQSNVAALKRLSDLSASIRPEPTRMPPAPLPKPGRTVSGQTYIFKANRMRLQSLTLTFQPSSDEALLQLNIRGETRRLAIGLDNVFRFTKVNQRLFAYKGTWESDNIFTYSYRYVNDSSFGDARMEFKGKEVIFDVHNKCSGISYNAVGKVSD